MSNKDESQMSYSERIDFLGHRFALFLNNGGATVAKNGRIADLSEGYSVGGFGPEFRLSDVASLKELARKGEWMKLGRLYTALFTVVKATCDDEISHIGFWVDTETDHLYADGSKIFLNRNDAMAEGKKRAQLTIYDFAKNVVFKVE